MQRPTPYTLADISIPCSARTTAVQHCRNRVKTWLLQLKNCHFATVYSQLAKWKTFSGAIPSTQPTNTRHRRKRDFVTHSEVEDPGISARLSSA
jgi:hypothetical protein